jgi:hypothetical protein
MALVGPGRGEGGYRGRGADAITGSDTALRRLWTGWAAALSSGGGIELAGGVSGAVRVR